MSKRSFVGFDSKRLQSAYMSALAVGGVKNVEAFDYNDWFCVSAPMSRISRAAAQGVICGQSQRCSYFMSPDDPRRGPFSSIQPSAAKLFK